eukprot:14441609-Ditylum_brightwellii.AAC.2
MFTDKQVIEANQSLLDSISSNSYEIYDKLCADDLTAFEAESRGVLVEGKRFHKYYFDFVKTLPEPKFKTNITMSNPHIRWVGKVCAIISYTRVNQRLDADSRPVTTTASETRIWEVRDGKLVHVHFHKS